MSDSVNNPSHYNAGSVETIDAIKSALGDAFLDYCRGNVLKYVWRCRHKGKLLEDLRKAAKYLEWAIAEAESEKQSEPEPLAIPEGWRELEENEPLCEDDLFELDGEWVGHEYDPSGGTYSSRIHRRHIRKIETLEPKQLAIPEGWRELEFGETRLKTDLYSYGGKWVPYTDFDPTESEFPKYDKRIHHQHIRKIETAKPEHVEGVWVEEADANAKKIKPAETSDASIPDPWPGYRLLSKEPPEPVVKGDEFFADCKWLESGGRVHADGLQGPYYYRRKIEPTEWIPKVGDKVRVVKTNMLATGRVGVVSKFDGKTCSVRIESEGLTSSGLEAKDVELVEAAS